jgi:hypothetical protein
MYLNDDETCYLVAANDLTRVDLDAEHVTSIEQAKVLANGVHPDAVFVFGVTNADMARDALSVAHAGPIAEYSGHVQADVLPMLIERVKSWDP